MTDVCRENRFQESENYQEVFNLGEALPYS